MDRKLLLVPLKSPPPGQGQSLGQTQLPTQEREAPAAMVPPHLLQLHVQPQTRLEQADLWQEPQQLLISLVLPATGLGPDWIDCSLNQ